MTKVISHLAQAGLVCQREHPTDKRRRELTLTGQGKKRALEVDKTFRKSAQGTLRILSQAEKKQLAEILRKLSLHLSKEKTTSGHAG
jgi:DNA-binding MarR family transcriptional regulator